MFLDVRAGRGSLALERPSGARHGLCNSTFSSKILLSVAFEPVQFSSSFAGYVAQRIRLHNSAAKVLITIQSRISRLTQPVKTSESWASPQS